MSRQMMLETITGTTTSGGAATVISGEPITGEIHSIVMDIDALAATADITITGNESGIAVVTSTDSNTNATLSPRTATHDVAAAASLYAAAGEPVEDKIPLSEHMKVVVAQGGATAAFTLYVYWR